MYREWNKIKFLQKYYMSLETTRLRGRPRNRWLDEVRDDGRLVCGKRWKEERNGRSS
jgi:hypothetical protein